MESWNDTNASLRERNRLLLWLKSTVEGLLFGQSSNVWNTYGGLTRLSKVVHEILGHCVHVDRRRQARQLPIIGPTCDGDDDDDGGGDDYWHFIAGLRVVAPTLVPTFERLSTSAEGLRWTRSSSEKCFDWVQARLREHSLAKYLSVVVDDRDHLESCYRSSAFLRHEDCRRALFVCLEAVVKNDLTMLNRLDPVPFVDRGTGEARCVIGRLTTGASPIVKKGHFRSPSLPENMTKLIEEDCRANSSQRKSSTPSMSASTRESTELVGPNCRARHRTDRDCRRRPRLRSRSSSDVAGGDDDDDVSSTPSKTRSRSEPSVVGALLLPKGLFSRLNEDEDSVQNLMETKSDQRLADEERQQKRENMIQQSPSHHHHHTRSKSDVSAKLYANYSDTAAAASSTNPGIPMSSSLPSFVRDEATPDCGSGGVGFTTNGDRALTTPIFRRPIEGQSLTSFLSSQDFRTCAELDKENAHFSISEALISAIEQIKCNQMLRLAVDEEDADSDDDEIKSLKQRIRIRRRERIQEKTMFKCPQLLSDGATDTPTTTSQSLSPRSTSSDKSDDNTSSDSVDPIDVSDVGDTDSTLGTLQDQSGLSLSLASLYSQDDLGRGTAAVAAAAAAGGPSASQTSRSANESSYERSRSTIGASAESVALSLIRKFSEKQLPKASDLEWLVSEQDAPQKLLPLPSSWPVSPDDADNDDDDFRCPTRLRGNLKWAPLRAQIIFNVHPPPQRKTIIAKQNYRCAGCGTKIDTGFLKRLSYCEYMGKYFCQCCHNGSLAFVPARVLRKWDFDRYPVSNFARDHLANVLADPLYDLDQLNPSLYRRSKALGQVHRCRLQLYHVKDFVRACRKCDSIAREMDDRMPAHLVDTPHVYSMRDLMQVKSGEMLAALKHLLTRSLSHVVQCELCQARGFFCEFCKNTREVIFPFQLDKVVQCPGCKSCHHTDCYIPNKCPKCARIELRRQRLVGDSDNDNDDNDATDGSGNTEDN